MDEQVKINNTLVDYGQDPDYTVNQDLPDIDVNNISLVASRLWNVTDHESSRYRSIMLDKNMLGEFNSIHLLCDSTY